MVQRKTLPIAAHFGVYHIDKAAVSKRIAACPLRGCYCGMPARTEILPGILRNTQKTVTMTVTGRIGPAHTGHMCSQEGLGLNRITREFLYHYTDFQALDGILRCTQLRVNNILNMNDAAEMRHFMRGLCAAVVRRLEQEGPREAVPEVRRLFREELKRDFSYSAYAACFSFHRDDAAQWERYGNRGRGVCIAFRSRFLEQMAGGALSLQKVFYQDDMDGHALASVFCRLIQDGAAVSADAPGIRDALRDAWICSVAFKHPSFWSEHEMRLVVFPFEQGEFDVQPCYHITTERIKKYYPLDLLSMCRRAGIGLEDLITELIIGPESTQSPAILQDYLRDNGLDRLADRISLSSCPLRRPPV